MHIKRNICKIPFWLHYYLEDFRIRIELKKINQPDSNMEKAERRLQNHMLRYCCKAFPKYYKAMGLSGKEVLEEYPLLSKKIMQDHPEWFCSKYDRWIPVHSFSTSGSTGTPFAFKLTPNHDPAHQRMLWTLMGYEKGDRIVLVNGNILPQENVTGDIFYYTLSKNQMPYGGWALSCLYLSEKTAEHYFRFLDKIKPAFIRGYSHAVFRLAQYARQADRTFDFRIKGIQLTSEMIFDDQIKLIEEVFHTHVYMQYGHSEACVFAYTTKSSMQYRCSPLYGHIEVLDDQGHHVKEGEVGEAVVTSYSNYAMPFIRYRTGDMVEYGGKDGAVILLNRVQGRKQEVMYTKSGEKVTTAVFITKTAYSHMLKWRIVQHEPGKLIFNIVKSPEYSQKDEDEIRDVYGKNGDFEVSFNYVEDIPLSKRGKAILVEQHLKD